MIFAPNKNYKLIELPNGLVIVEVGNNQIEKLFPGAQPLMIGDAGPLLTYMDRYFFERQNGKTLAEAHDLAMKTAGITKVIPKGTKFLG